VADAHVLSDPLRIALPERPGHTRSSPRSKRSARRASSARDSATSGVSRRTSRAPRAIPPTVNGRTHSEAPRPRQAPTRVRRCGASVPGRSSAAHRLRQPPA
jgi:hypothetical protein